MMDLSPITQTDKILVVISIIAVFFILGLVFLRSRYRLWFVYGITRRPGDYFRSGIVISLLTRDRK